jgi:hypothetical protein
MTMLTGDGELSPCEESVGIGNRSASNQCHRAA